MTASDSTVRWHLPPESARVLLGADGALRLHEWLATGAATTIKDAAHRTIYRVQSNNIDFYLKQYRAVGPRNRLREVLRSTKAKAEYDQAAALSQRGIPVPRPLGWGILGNAFAPRASFLLSETVADARHLTEVLLDLTPARRLLLSTALGQFVAQLHAAGVTHRDFHPGNLLVRWPADAPPHFVLIDLHEVHVGRPLAWRQRRDNLCVFNRYFILRATRTDRLRFWRAYAQAAGRALPDHPDATPNALEAATVRSNNRFWKARVKKYLDSNRLVELFDLNSLDIDVMNVQTLSVRSIDPDFATNFRSNPDAAFDKPNAAFLKQGGRSTVVRTPQGVLKRFNIASPLMEMCKGLLRRSQAKRSWLFGHALLDASLPTPRPLLYGLAGYDIPHAEYLLTEELHHVVNIREFVELLATLPGSERRIVLRERIRLIARTIRQLHDRHFGHRDLKAGNLLTPADPADHRVWFIDLVGVSRRRRVSRKARVHDLARLLASFLNHPGLTHGDRLRFLFAYFGAKSHDKAGWRRWWRELAEAAQAKVDRTRQRGRPLG